MFLHTVHVRYPVTSPHGLLWWSIIPIGSEQRWLSNSDRESAPKERQRKRTVSGRSPIPPLSKLVVDCPQTSLLVLHCTNKALCRGEQGPSRSCYCNRSPFWPGLLFSARKTTITTSAHSPGSWTRVRGSPREGGGCPVNAACRGSSLTLHLWFWSDWNCCWRLTQHLRVQLAYHPGKFHHSKVQFGVHVHSGTGPRSLSLAPTFSLGLSCIQSGAGPQRRERFLGLLKTNKREGIHASLKTKYWGSLHTDHTTTSQWSNLFVIKKFALWCPHPDNNRSILPSPCYDHGLFFSFLSPSVLGCCSCNIISVCVWKIPLLYWWHLEKAAHDPLNDSWKRDSIVFLWPSLWVSLQVFKPSYITALSRKNYNRPWLVFQCIYPLYIYIYGPFNGSTACESRFSCGLHHGSNSVSTFAIKISFCFFFGSAFLYSVVTSKGREKRWREEWRKKRKMER